MVNPHERTGQDAELELVSLRDAPATLVEALYTDLLKPTFPPDELAPLESFLPDQGGTTDGVIAHQAGRVRGGLVYEHYVDGAVLLIAYLVVDPGARGHGLGGRLLRQATEQSDSEVALAEIEDPRFWPTTEVSKPAARLEFWTRSGGQLLPLPYVQPSLGAGTKRVPHLLLIAVPRHGEELPESLPGELVGRFLREYFQASEGGFDPQDPELGRLLEVCEADRLALWPLDRLEVAG